MATLHDLLAQKGHEVIAVRPADTVLQVANLMNERNIGGVVVVDDGRLTGIFTERDVLRRIVAPGRDPATTQVAAVMSAPVITCQADLSVDDCAALMTARGVRHLPVQDGAGLTGVVTIRDLLAHKVGEQQATLEQMNHCLFELRWPPPRTGPRAVLRLHPRRLQGSVRRRRGDARMFVGHYGVSFAAKTLDRRIPLWTLFVAVQLLDVLWAPLVLLGVEKVRIVPGITASNPFDLYYMPYTHSLLAAVIWSLAALWAYHRWGRASPGGRAAVVVGLAVLSHWVLDLVVHRPDLPLYDNTAKVGLGLWNRPVLAFALEAALLLGSMAVYLRGQHRGRGSLAVLGLVMLAVQARIFFGPPPLSDRAAALIALVSYGTFAGLIGWWERRSSTATASAA